MSGLFHWLIGAGTTEVEVEGEAGVAEKDSATYDAEVVGEAGSSEMDPATYDAEVVEDEGSAEMDSATYDVESVGEADGRAGSAETESGTLPSMERFVCIASDQLDIYILCDTTGSMGDYVNSLVATIKQMVGVIRILLPNRARIGVISYKDYCDKASCTDIPIGASPEAIVDFVNDLSASGGGDAPEATKTGLNRIADMIRESEGERQPLRRKKSLVIHYTDAPPHCEESDSDRGNKRSEQDFLRGKEPGYDWVQICRFFARRNIPIYTFLTANSQPLTKVLMLHLGPVVLMRDKSSYNVTKATIGMLMHVLGQKFDYDDDFTMLGCDLRPEALLGYRREGWGEEQGEREGDQLGATGGLGGSGRGGGGGGGRNSYDAPHLDLSRNSRVTDETRRGGFPDIRSILPFLSEKNPFRFPTIGIDIDMRQILRQFTQDPTFQDVVFAVLMEMFTPECCLSLTYNPILGKLWRIVCRMRGDDRLTILRSKLSDAIGGVRDARHQKQMKDWLEQSYNAEEEIADLVLSTASLRIDGAEGGATDSDHSFSPPSHENRLLPCVILDPSASLGAEPDVIREGFRSLARAPTASGLALAQRLMTSLILVDQQGVELPSSPNDPNVPLYLPVAMLPKDLFGCLPHLASPGMMFTLRPAMMVAILAYLSGNKFLVKEAEDFLQANVGQWINLDDVAKIPEVLSDETVKLLRRVPKFLTDEERFVFERLYLIWRMRIAFRRDFSLKMAILPDLKSVFPDYRFLCISCGNYRSFTLITEDGRCGCCFYRDESDAAHEVVPSDVEDKESKSRLVSCRSCLGIYEVVKTQDLNVEPKCYYCRIGKVPTKVTCDSCANSYILPNSQLLDKMKAEQQPMCNGHGGGDAGTSDHAADAWRCAICVTAPHLSFEQVSLTLKDILSSNPHLMEVFDMVESSFNIINGRASNFKLFTEYWKELAAKSTTDEKEDQMESHSAPTVTIKRRRVFNVDGLIREISDAVEKGDLKELCLLCCEEKSLTEMAPSPCGHCKNPVCYECLRLWMNQIQPGKVVLPSHLVCPFCKTVPQEKIFRMYNRPAKSLLHKEHLKNVVRRMDPALYYGWCKGCSKIREIGPVECGAVGQVPFSTGGDFTCEPCKMMMERGPDVPKCPGCQAPTVKAFGCNHIQCPVCHTHWCYVCNEKHDEATIYDHLVEKHGSIGLGEDPEGFDPMHD